MLKDDEIIEELDKKIIKIITKKVDINTLKILYCFLTI